MKTHRMLRYSIKSMLENELQVSRYFPYAITTIRIKCQHLQLKSSTQRTLSLPPSYTNPINWDFNYKIIWIKV